MKDKGTLIRLQKSAEIAKVKPNESVLDLGCGDSFIKNYMPKRIIYVGVDLMGANIPYNLEIGLPNDILNSQFDVIFLNEFIEHIENFRSLLIECKNVLTLHGRIIISTPSNNRILIGEDPTHIHCFRKTNMKNLANICDLKIEKIIGTYIRLPPILPFYFVVPTNQTLYTEVIIYRMIHETNNR